MSNIKISHEYTMSQQDLKSKIDELASEMHDRYKVECLWQSDDCLTFKRSGASGEIAIEPTELHFSMKLGLMLGAFKSPIERDVQKFLTKYIH